MTRDILKKGIAVAALVGAFVVTNAQQADAAFVAWICNDVQCTGGGDVAVTDGAAGDASGVAGVVVAVGSVGGLTVAVNTSSSKPALTEPSMDLNFTAVGVGEVWFYASDTDFSVVRPLSGSIDGNFSGNGSVDGRICGGTNNLSGTLANCVQSAVDGSSPFSIQLAHGGSTVGAPYALTIGVHIVRTSAGITTGDFLVVPEPASMALFGLGLAGLAAFRRRAAR